jgi:hypothetical protein
MVEAFSSKLQGGSDWVVPLADSLACAKASDQIASFVAG